MSSRLLSLIILFFTSGMAKAQTTSGTPVRVAVAGISHGHVGWILGRNKPDVVIAGIYEKDIELAKQYAKRFNLSNALFYTDLGNMLDAVKPDAALAFGPVYDHLAVVEAAAPRGIHVMVEKPLAANLGQALKMDSLAHQYKIHLLTNFETSWYPTTAKTYQLVNDSNAFGEIRKVVVHDGHPGPKEIGVGKEFLAWLTDPVLNGGGALMDFGCYGANLMTYLMKGKEPLSVTAITQHLKPAIYPKVEDEATIVLTYPSAQCIIQASWNWPFSRKDMEVYGTAGHVIAVDGNTLRVKVQGGGERTRDVKAGCLDVYEDPFSYLADVLRKKISVPENGLYALKTNLVVMRILEAAKLSAAKGEMVYWKDLK